MPCILTVTTPDGETVRRFRTIKAGANAAAEACKAFNAGQFSTEPAMWQVSARQPRAAFGNSIHTHFVELFYLP